MKLKLFTNPPITPSIHIHPPTTMNSFALPSACSSLHSHSDDPRNNLTTNMSEPSASFALPSACSSLHSHSDDPRNNLTALLASVGSALSRLHKTQYSGTATAHSVAQFDGIRFALLKLFLRDGSNVRPLNFGRVDLASDVDDNARIR